MSYQLMFFLRKPNKKRCWCIKGGTTYYTNVGSGASIDNLATGDFTIDGWFRIPKTGGTQYLCQKGTINTTGWHLRNATTGKFSCVVYGTTLAIITSATAWDDTLWHYIMMTYRGASDKKVRIYVDTVLDGTSNAAIAELIDETTNGYISNNGSGLTGAHGWIRWSNIVRSIGRTSRFIPPMIDVNTMAQWNTNQESGGTLIDSSVNVNHGTIVNGTWIKM